MFVISSDLDGAQFAVVSLAALSQLTVRNTDLKFGMGMDLYTFQMSSRVKIIAQRPR